MKNYFDYWYKRTIKDGLKAIKFTVGVDIAIVLGYSVNIPVGLLFFKWTLVEFLIERN